MVCAKHCIACGVSTLGKKPGDVRTACAFTTYNKILETMIPWEGVYTIALNTCREAFKQSERVIICSPCQLHKSRTGFQTKHAPLRKKRVRSDDDEEQALGPLIQVAKRNCDKYGKVYFPIDAFTQYLVDPSLPYPDSRIVERIVVSWGKGQELGYTNPYLMQVGGPVQPILQNAYQAWKENKEASNLKEILRLAIHDGWMRFNGFPVIVPCLAISKLNRRRRMKVMDAIAPKTLTREQTYSVPWTNQLQKLVAQEQQRSPVELGHFSYTWENDGM
jgi:hypothetical protein